MERDGTIAGEDGQNENGWSKNVYFTSFKGVCICYSSTKYYLNVTTACEIATSDEQS